MKTANRLIPLIGSISLVLMSGTTPKAQQPFTEYDFPLEPGATMTITVTFNSSLENAVSFWDQRVGGRFSKWPGCGNFDPNNPKTFTYTNPENATIPLALNAGYKLTPPNPNAPWNISNGVVSKYDPNSPREIILGYPNAMAPNGGDPSNTKITITVSKGNLPDPRTRVAPKK